MQNRDMVTLIGMVLLFFALLGIGGYLLYKVKKLEIEKEIEIKRIEKQQTEERAKAWHVPWGGKDIEEETNDDR